MLPFPSFLQWVFSLSLVGRKRKELGVGMRASRAIYARLFSQALPLSRTSFETPIAPCISFVIG